MIDDPPSDSSWAPEIGRLQATLDDRCSVRIDVYTIPQPLDYGEINAYVAELLVAPPWTGSWTGSENPITATVDVDSLGLTASATVGIRAESVARGPLRFTDRVPNVGSLALPLRFKSGCVVPRLKGVRRSTARKRLKQAGCRYSIRGGRGRVRRVSHKAGTRTADRVTVRCRAYRAR